MLEINVDQNFIHFHPLNWTYPYLILDLVVKFCQLIAVKHHMSE